MGCVWSRATGPLQFHENGRHAGYQTCVMKAYKRKHAVQRKGLLFFVRQRSGAAFNDEL